MALSNAEKDEIIDRLIERLETDPALQAKLMGVVTKGFSKLGGLAGIMKLLGGGKP